MPVNKVLSAAWAGPLMPAPVPRLLTTGRAAPLELLEGVDAGTTKRDPFRDEERALQVFASTIPAEPATRSNDAVRGHIGLSAFAHDVADSPGCPRTPGHLRHVAVGGHAARRYTADD